MNIKGKTEQEVFDLVYNGLKSQGFQRSYLKKKRTEEVLGRSGICRYRGPDGLKCAVGHLISDEDYYEDIEDCPAIADVVLYLVGLHFYEDSEMVSFISKLQQIHDSHPKTMQKHLKKFAARNKLIVPE